MNLKNLLFTIGTIFILVLSSCSDDFDDVDIQEANQEHQFDSNRRACNSTEHTLQLMSDPEYKAKHQKLIDAFRVLNSQPYLKAQCAEPVKVPVAIHYQGVNNPNSSCLQQLAIDQINRLNLDYSGENSDIGNWTNQAVSQFPGVSNGETCVEFVIADQNHPSGYGLSNGDLAITINRTQGDKVNNWADYINIFVIFNTGYLGYAPLGGSGNGDGVVIDASAFGAGAGCGSVVPQSPYDLGRTLTHEMGHYLLLDHIWGNGCNVDDDVNDTPDQQSDYGGCPNLGASSCGSTDMHMNYMDYTNDACMYMFSEGQSNRMSNYLQASLGNVTSNLSNVYSGSGGSGGGDTGGDGNGNGGGDTGESCDIPTNSTNAVVNNSTIRIDWTSQPEAIRYKIAYRVKGTRSWTRKNTSPNFIQLSNLEAREYEYRLRTRCPEGWTAWSAKFTFDLSDSGGTGGQSSDEYRIRVTLDDYGSETDWYLYDEVNNLVENGGPYNDGTAGTVKNTTVILSNGCYEIDLYDSYGDGICCDYGNGKMEIWNSNNSIIADSDGRFGFYELIQFCVDNGSARIVNREKDVKRMARGDKKK